MFPSNIFWIAIMLITASALGYDELSTVSVDKTKFVEYYFENYTAYDEFCQQKGKEGIYSPFSPGSVDGSVKCCRGKFLVEPFLVLRKGDGSEVQYPPFTQCDYNVTIENGNDDIGTLMWKIYACKVKSILGKGEKNIDFKTYVKFRTLNYTMVNNVQKFIRDGIKDGKGCPEGDEEPIFLKKLEKYFWCFQGHEHKICEVPTTDESKVTLTQRHNATRTSNDKMNVTCPLVPAGTSYAELCCNGVSTPSSWLRRFTTAIHIESPRKRLPNGTIVTKKSYSDCVRTSQNLMVENNMEEKGSDPACYRACEVNPVTFSADGSSKPEIRLELSTVILNKYLSWFNTAARNAIQKMVTKTEREYGSNNSTINESWKNTGIIFKDAGEVFKKLASPREKALLYCAYFNAVDNIMMLSSSALCHA